MSKWFYIQILSKFYGNFNLWESYIDKTTRTKLLLDQNPAKNWSFYALLTGKFSIEGGKANLGMAKKVTISKKIYNLFSMPMKIGQNN